MLEMIFYVVMGLVIVGVVGFLILLLLAVSLLGLRKIQAISFRNKHPFIIKIEGEIFELLGLMCTEDAEYLNYISQNLLNKLEFLYTRGYDIELVEQKLVKLYDRLLNSSMKNGQNSLEMLIEEWYAT